MTRTLIAIGVVASLGTAFAQQQPTPAALPTYDVVSIKVNNTGSEGMMLRNRPDGVTYTNTRVLELLGRSFPVPTSDIVGLPSWASTTRFDIDTAVAPGTPSPTTEQRQLMLRAVLLDRFNLKARIEKREQPAFDLVLARNDGKLGPNLTPADGTCTGRMDPACFGWGETSLEGEFSVSLILTWLKYMAGRPVVDRTGLTGRYMVKLQASPPAGLGASEPAASDLPSIFTAVQEQLGLKLEPSRAMVDTLVVESIEMPTPN